MTNRPLLNIVRNQNPLIFKQSQSIQSACDAMCQRRAGSVLVVDQNNRLCGIFTGRDAVRVLAAGSAAELPLSVAMTRSPTTIDSKARAIDALRLMSDGGFRHIPVVDDGCIWGIVSRGDFLGSEIERLEDDDHLAECIW